MQRSDRFLISRRAFAIDLSTLTGEQKEREGRWSFHGSANAVWYRRKDKTTRACLGRLGLFAFYLPEPVDVTDPCAVLSANLDGRYGGDCFGRWDGELYWGAQKPAQIEADLAVLRPMLANYPSMPDGYDGWWRY